MASSSDNQATATGTHLTASPASTPDTGHVQQQQVDEGGLKKRCMLLYRALQMFLFLGQHYRCSVSYNGLSCSAFTLEVEKHVAPVAKTDKNYEGKNPQVIFTEKHKELVIQGEKWMRDTANSCSIVAALIVTIVFAAAITVPGGNDDQNGLPNFLTDRRFIIFAISDAISLFTSTTSLLMFLAILTSRYAESDFLYALPRKLIIGLVTLFLSITFMMIAFGSTVYLMFGHGKAWILTGVLMLGSLPITSFAFLQFPLLVDVISSTYGPGIFGKKSDRRLI